MEPGSAWGASWAAGNAGMNYQEMALADGLPHCAAEHSTVCKCVFARAGLTIQHGIVDVYAASCICRVTWQFEQLRRRNHGVAVFLRLKEAQH